MKKPGANEIATQLRREISKGARAKNERLPSERVLAEDYGVARNTIRDALTKLEDDAYVEIRRGSGTYIVYEPPQASANAIENACEGSRRVCRGRRALSQAARGNHGQCAFDLDYRADQYGAVAGRVDADASPDTE